MNKSKTIRLVYGIFLSVLTVAVGVVFIVQAADIYYGGKANSLTPIYSVESVKSHLLLPTIFLFVWIAAAVVGYVLYVVYPIQTKRRNTKDYAKMLTALKTLVPREGEEFADARKTLKRMSVVRTAIWGAVFAVLLAGGIYIAVYVFDPAHYHSDAMHEDILNLVRNVIWWLVASLVCVFVAMAYESFSLRREVDLTRKALATAPGSAKKHSETVSPKQKVAIALTSTVVAVAIALFVALPSIASALVSYATSQNSNAFAVILSTALLLLALAVECAIVFVKYNKYVPDKADKIIKLTVRITLGVVAVAFVIAGVFNGGARDVLIKAVNICTECIGLG